MKNIIISSILCLSITGCFGTNFNKSGPGILFTSTVDPVFYDNNVKQNKTGSACSVRVLALASTGDASINAAKNSAGIKKVASADTEYLNILGLFGKACTKVTGE